MRLALIGCGFIGGIHSMVLRGLRQASLTDAQVVAVCDRDPDRAGMFALYHGAGVATSDPVEAIREADAAWICTPTATHLELVTVASEAGTALYCEKPLAPDLMQVESLVATARKAGIPVQVGLVLRHSRVLKAAARLVESGTLGELMAVVLRDDQYFPIQGQYASTWRADFGVSGGGTLIEHSIHDLDALAWLAGPALSLAARTANFAGHPRVEDLAAVTVTHAGGATSTLTSVWHSVLSRPSTRRFDLICREGILWTDDEAAGPLHLQTSAGVEEVNLGTSGSSGSAATETVAATLELSPELGAALSIYVESDLAFLQSLAAEKDPYPGLDTALYAHRLVDRAYRSAAQGGIPLEA